MSWMHGLEHDQAEWAGLRERHRAQDEALERFLGLVAGLAQEFETLHTKIGTLNRDIRELGRQQAAFELPGRQGAFTARTRASR
jgi:hypothetical protein